MVGDPEQGGRASASEPRACSWASRRRRAQRHRRPLRQTATARPPAGGGDPRLRPARAAGLMVLDASALVAVLFDEPERDDFIRNRRRTPTTQISPRPTSVRLEATSSGPASSPRRSAGERVITRRLTVSPRRPRRHLPAVGATRPAWTAHVLDGPGVTCSPKPGPDKSAQMDSPERTISRCVPSPYFPSAAVFIRDDRC